MDAKVDAWARKGGGESGGIDPRPQRLFAPLAALLLGVLSSVMSSAMATMALPALGAHFAIGPATTQWAASSFLLSMVGALLAMPWLVRRWGGWRLYLAALALLAVGAGLSATAGTFGALLGGRVLQGMAAGAIQPLPTMLIGSLIPPGMRGRVTAAFLSVVGVLIAVGPSVGGAVVEAWGWRAVFALAIPLAVGAMVLTLRMNLQQAQTSSGAVPPRRFDALGLALAQGCATCVLAGIGLQKAGHGAVAAWASAGAVALGLGFGWWQKRLATQGLAGRFEPLVDWGLWSDRHFLRGWRLAALYGALLYSLVFLLPQLLMQGLAMSAARAGAILLPAGIAMLLTMLVCGRALDKSPHRPVAALGFGLSALALFAVAVTVDEVRQQAHLAWMLLFCLVVVRAGLGLVLPALNEFAVSQLPPGQVPQGACQLLAAQYVSGAVATALCGTFLQWRAGVPALAAGSDMLDSQRELLVLLGVVALVAAALASSYRVARR